MSAITARRLDRERAAPDWAGVGRALLQALLLIPVVRWLCRPLRVTGARSLPDGPILLVANHASHADTAAIIAALPWRVRMRLAPAAAADYFFSSRVRGAAVQALVGAFPFPRHGGEGIARARRLLASGRAVLLFPEGTRSRSGEMGAFRCGVAKLAVLGYPVVPVAVHGTYAVLPAGRGRPRRAPVSIAFGPPEYLDHRPEGPQTARLLEGRVRGLLDRARAAAPAARPSWYARARSLACSRTGLVLAFAWGVAESVAWPVVPDFAVALLALAAPGRFLALGAAAVAGSLAGGAVAYGLGALAGSGFLEHAPLVTDRMIAAAEAWLADEGAVGLRHQPLSGVPFKALGWQAADAGVGVGSFLAHTALARAPRVLLVAAAFAGAGAILRRWIQRAYAPLAALFIIVFFAGLARVVAAWS